MAKIRVMIIDDSLVFREFLSRSLSTDFTLEVVGTFGDPIEAMNNIRRLQPDVMTVDMEMPKMRGNEFMRLVLPKHPNVKAVVISALSGNVFDAMHAGAIDFVGKPGSRPGYEREQFVSDVIQKVKIAAAARVMAPQESAARRTTTAAAPVLPLTRANMLGVTPRSLIAIGASTGGTEAILEVIKNFPANSPATVIVQHMPPGFTQMYAERVDKICPMKVREAKNGERVERGTALIAPGGDQQMRVRYDGSGYVISLMNGPKVNGHCPSVDILFDSVVTAAGSNAVGVLLTGMGADGARGLTAMRQTGSYTIGQDKDSCVVYGMPKVAYDLGGVTQQLPLANIGPAVLRCFSK